MISFVSGSAPSATDSRRPHANSCDVPADRERFDPRDLEWPNPRRRLASTNIVSAVDQILRPEVVARAGARMGFDQVLLQRAFRAGVPGLLAALSALAFKPLGARALYKVVSEQELNSLACLAGDVGDDKRALAVVVRGLTGLTSLLGEDKMSALTHAVSRYAGLGTSASKCVMGLLGAIILGVLEQQRRAKALDAEGLEQLLASQNEHIDHALPSCFAEFLHGAGILAALPQGHS